MKRAFGVSMSLAMVLCLSVTAIAAGAPGANGAAKAPLYLDSGWTCPGGANPVGDTYGFVVMNINNNGTLIGTMHLTGLTPGASYWLWIAGTDIDGIDCPGTPTIAKPVTADANGKLKYNFKFADVPAQSYVWAGAEGDIRVQSTAVSLTYPAAP